MPYHVGSKGSYGCSGYPAVKDDGTVMGCHKTRGAAARQIYAINVSEGNIGKAMVKEGDMVMAPNDDEVYVGRVVHVMTDGMLGFPGSEYSLMASAEEPALLIQLFEMEEGGLDETKYFVGFKASEVMPMPSLESNVGMDKSIGNIVNKSMYRVDANNAGCSGSFAVVDEDGEVEGCFETREQANAFVEAKNKEEQMDDAEDMMEMGKATANAPYQDAQMDNESAGEMQMAAKPNYGEMIQPRRGGSTPANPRLYAIVVQAAKDKFDVYPSAVANAWVVQEYKRRGGTYKMYDEDMGKREFSTAARERMAGAGTAMPDGSFPIANRADLMNAIRSVGRAKDYGAARAHIIRRARALNAMDMLPEDWRNKATKGVGEWSGSIFDLNPFVK